MVSITYSKGRREASFHPSVSSSISSSIQSSIRLVMVCLLQWGGERVEYRCGVNTCGMSYIKRFWNVVCNCNFVICIVKYTHTCALGTGFKLVYMYRRRVY